MLKPALSVSALLIFQTCVIAQDQANRNQVAVEVVATASEYVPHSTTVSHPGHSYTDCHGHTSYLGDFYGSEDFTGHIRGEVSGTAETDTRCSTTFSPPTTTTFATYRKVNYTVAKGERAIYLLACTAYWKPSVGTRIRAAIAASPAPNGPYDSNKTHEAGDPQEKAQRIISEGPGHWSDCPAFIIGDRYTLSILNTSDARLGSAAGTKPIKLEFLRSVPLPVGSTASAQSQATGSAGEAKIHITSSPSGGEIYVDGKFFGNTPSDITLPVGDHSVRITLGNKEWTRSVQVTAGEISVHAEIPQS